MGFFGEFNAWLTGILNAYIGQTLAVIAGILEPVDSGPSSLLCCVLAEVCR